MVGDERLEVCYFSTTTLHFNHIKEESTSHVYEDCYCVFCSDMDGVDSSLTVIKETQRIFLLRVSERP